MVSGRRHTLRLEIRQGEPCPQQCRFTSYPAPYMPPWPRLESVCVWRFARWRAPLMPESNAEQISAVGQYGEHLGWARAMGGLKWRLGRLWRGGRGRVASGVASWLAWGLDRGTWGLGALRLANRRAEAEKPAAAGAGRAGKEGCAGCYWLIR